MAQYIAASGNVAKLASNRSVPFLAVPALNVKVNAVCNAREIKPLRQGLARVACAGIIEGIAILTRRQQ